MIQNDPESKDITMIPMILGLLALYQALIDENLDYYFLENKL